MILKCAYDGHFAFPWGHRRGFMNGGDAFQLMLIGHVTIDNMMNAVRPNYIHATHYRTIKMYSFVPTQGSMWLRLRDYKVAITTK